ncbi:MAG TPA: homocysteine S-methyltransferase family protein, partial [Terriglobales bacterium]
PPEHMLSLLEEMRKAVPNTFLAAQPVAYHTPAEKPDFTSLPQFPFELDPLQLTRREMAAYAQRARDIGVNYIGACCGTVAIHIREMARALGKIPADQRPWALNYEKPMSAYEYYDHDPAAVGAPKIERKAAKQS